MTEALKVPATADAVSDTYSTEQTFESLGVAENLCKALADQGITTAFPIQAMTIADALSGRDVCGKAKTGSGKTLAFGLPMLQRAEHAGTTVRRQEGRPRGRRRWCCCRRASSPSRSSTSSSRSRKGSGLRVVAVYGGADIERQVRQLRKGCDVIIATPGRLIDLGDRGELVVEALDVLVLDEADRMADMGFMPQVEWVLRRIVGARTRRCCSRRRSTARSTASSSAT